MHHASAILNRVFLISTLALALFLFLVHAVPLTTLIITLNGLFTGTVAALMISFGPILYHSLAGIDPYGRVRQMTIGFALCWFAYGLAVYTSVYFRSSGVDVNGSVMTALSRYVAVIAAVLQVTAPDFGLGIFHGRERKTLWTGAAVGLIIAVVIIYAQQTQALAETTY